MTNQPTPATSVVSPPKSSRRSQGPSTPKRTFGRADSADSHDVTCVEGHLLKQAKRGFKHWNDRYFVLEENKLTYYDSEEKTKVKDTFDMCLGACTISSLYMDQRQSPTSGAKTKELLYCFRISLFVHQAMPDDASGTQLHINDIPQLPPSLTPQRSGTISPLRGQSSDGEDCVALEAANHLGDAPLTPRPKPSLKKRPLFKKTHLNTRLGETNASNTLSDGKPQSLLKGHIRKLSFPKDPHPPPSSLSMDDEARRFFPRLLNHDGEVPSTDHPSDNNISEQQPVSSKSYHEQQQWQEQQLIHAHYQSEQKEYKKRMRKRIKDGGKLAVAAGAAVTVGVLTAGVGLLAGLVFLGAGAGAAGTGAFGGAAYRQQRKKQGEIVLATPHYEEAKKWKTALEACLVSETVVRDSTWGQLFVMDGRSAKTALLPTEIITTKNAGSTANSDSGPRPTSPRSASNFDEVHKAPFFEAAARWEPIQGGWSTLLGTGTQGLRIFREERNDTHRGRLSVKDDTGSPPLKAQSALAASPLQAFLCLMSLPRVPTVVNDITSSQLIPNSGQCASFRIIERMDDHTDVIHLFFRPLYLFPSWTSPRDFVLFRYWRYEPDGSYVVCLDSIEHLGCRPQPGYTRGDMHGVYTIAPQKRRQGEGDERGTECLLTSVVQVNPRGWVPRSFLSTYAEAFGVSVLLQMLDIKDALDHERFVPVPLDAASPIVPYRRLHHPSIEKSAAPITDDDPYNYDFAYANHESPPPNVSGKSISIGLQPPPLPHHMWAEPAANSFRVRGKTYKKDKIKINAGSSIARLVAVDVVRVDECVYSGFSLLPSERIQLALEREKKAKAMGLPSDVPPFVFLVNILLPGPPLYHALYYYAIDDMSSIDGTDGTPSSKLCQQFFFGDSDEFRDKTFKLIPTIVEGNFVVKKAVGSTPAIMGTKLAQHYVKRGRFFEVILDCGSSSVATGVIRLSLGYAKTLVVDMGFLFEGTDETTLPERIFGCARMKYPEFGSALRKVSLPPSANGSPAKDGESSSHKDSATSF